MRRAEARSAGIDRPDGVARAFQVSVYKVEPTEAVLACNLFAKDCVRAALRDEVEEGRPEMPLVVKPSAFACRAERLAGARCCPNWAIVRPPSTSQGVGPDADPPKQMHLDEIPHIVGVHIFDASVIYYPRRDLARLNEFAQPIRRKRINFVIVGPLFHRVNLAQKVVCLDA